MNLEFTSKERDAETGLDYFGARYMSAAQGRFTSPDLPLYDQHPSDPQSWNLYSYVRNNPLSFVDPTGRSCQAMSNGTVYDDLDGKGCATIDQQDKVPINNSASKDNPLVEGNTVTADVTKPQTFGDSSDFLKFWWSGQLPGNIAYGENDGATTDMRNSPNARAERLNYIKVGCPETYAFSQGHFSAYGRILAGYASGSPNHTENQIGGYRASVSNPNTGKITFQISNNAGYSSFVGQTTWGPWIGQRANAWDNPNGPNGPRHNVLQAFTWTEQNPCDMH